MTAVRKDSATMTIVWAGGEKTVHQIEGSEDIEVVFNIPRAWAV